MQRYSLNGRWQFREAGKGSWLGAQVPGCVHLDLVSNRRIPEPYYRDHEKKLFWIGEREWAYRRRFRLSREMAKCRRVVLRCHGLDTLATLRLNGELLGKTDNMFRTWEFDLKPHLRDGENELEIRFASTFPYLKERQQRRPAPDNRKHPLATDFPTKPYGLIRKEQCNYGWDWNITAVTCGIWRDIEIVAFDQARIANFAIAQKHRQDGKVELTITCDAEKAAPGRLWCQAKVSLVDQGTPKWHRHSCLCPSEAREKITHRQECLCHTAQRQDSLIPGQDAHAPAATVAVMNRTPLRNRRWTATLTIAKPRLWWPNGMGKQPLYGVEVELSDENGKVLDATSRRIGLRTLKLERKKDRWGESFQFVANDVPFFAKGANWVPADAFAPRACDPQRYARLVDEAARANCNMFRVWGGGHYEADEFYDLCDEAGICIWQDFMFACAAYPAYDPEFMATVAREAEDQVRRLRHHACLALWCGNNELELLGYVRAGKPNPKGRMTWPEYNRLFNRVLPAAVARHHPDCDYWPSSPHAPGKAKVPQAMDRGDTHLWQVWFSSANPITLYETMASRFCSEFGFQSFPDPATIRNFTLPADRDFSTPVMLRHQRAHIGNTKIMRHVLQWFRYPKDFEGAVWLSQLVHGLCMKLAVEHWRRGMPQCMGALIWQYNDSWPVASGAMLDHALRPKALHHMARRFFAPLLVSAEIDEARQRAAIHVTSDLTKPAAATLDWFVLGVDGEVSAHGNRRLNVPPGRSTVAARIDMKPYLIPPNEHRNVLWLELRVAGKLISSNLYYFTRPSMFRLEDPGLKVRVRKGAATGEYIIALAAAKPAFWTWLELPGKNARFADSFFHLRPGCEHEVTVEVAGSPTAEQIRRNLRVRSLYDLAP